MKCDQMHFPTAKAHTDLWYERPAVAKANDRAHKRRLLASAPPMTAEAALCAAAAAGLVKVRGRSSVAQRLGGVYGTGGPTLRPEALGALLPLSPHLHTARPSRLSTAQSYTRW